MEQKQNIFFKQKNQYQYFFIIYHHIIKFLYILIFILILSFIYYFKFIFVSSILKVRNLQENETYSEITVIIDINDTYINNNFTPQPYIDYLDETIILNEME